MLKILWNMLKLTSNLEDTWKPRYCLASPQSFDLAGSYYLCGFLMMISVSLSPSAFIDWNYSVRKICCFTPTLIVCSFIVSI